MLSRQVASTVDHLDKDGPCCHGPSWDNVRLGKPRVVVSNTNDTHGKPFGQGPPARSNNLKLGLSREANKPSSAALVGRSKTITHSVAGMLLTLGCCLNY